MNRIKIILLLMITTATAWSQTVVIHEDVKDSVYRKKKAWSRGLIYELTFYGGADEPGINGTIARSLGTNILINIKYQPAKFLAIPLSFGYTSDAYGFSKSGGNYSFPDTAAYSKLRFSSGGFAFGAGMRLMHKKLFMELGFLEKWHPWHSYFYQVNDGKNDLNVYIKKLSFVNQLNTDIYARIGFRVFTVSASYRLTNMFSANSDYHYVTEMPRLRLGTGFCF